MIYRCAILAACLVALLPSAPAYAWKETAHQSQLTQTALDLFKAANTEKRYPDEIWKKFAEAVKIGAHDEDLPVVPGERLFDHMELLLRCRANNHYRHAISGLGLTGAPITPMGDQDVDALTWALTNAYLDVYEEFADGAYWHLKQYKLKPRDVAHGNMSWQMCVNRFGYTERAKLHAYYTLGFVLHLLQDMGCPEHVHDDPHGDSGYTGFEWFVEKNWERLMPKVAKLRPKVLPQVQFYFDRLAKIGYSANRFQGWDPEAGGKPRIDPGSDLAQMFRCHSIHELQPTGVDTAGLPGAAAPHSMGWWLENPVEPRKILASPLVRYRWHPHQCEENSFLHKAWDTRPYSGQFWPTCHEMNGVPVRARNDKPGFFYLELSDDIPHVGSARDLRPLVFLPTPLKEVAAECGDWSRTGLKGKVDMYELIAKCVLPHVITYSAGLIQHYLALVNHPPFVRRVTVYGNALSYRAEYEDRIGRSRETDTIDDVLSREFVLIENQPVKPGQVLIRIEFSEPVDAPKVQVGGQTLRMSQIDDGSSWSGFAHIPEAGGDNEQVALSIQATDRHAHHEGQGGALDANPITPARRRAVRTKYGWRGYEMGADRSFHFRVVREDQRPPDQGWEGKWAITSTHEKGRAKGMSFSWSFEVVRRGRGYAVITPKAEIPATVTGNVIEWDNDAGGNRVKIVLTREGNRLTGTFRGAHYSGDVKDDDIAGSYQGHRSP